MQSHTDTCVCICPVRLIQMLKDTFCVWMKCRRTWQNKETGLIFRPLERAWLAVSSSFQSLWWAKLSGCWLHMYRPDSGINLVISLARKQILVGISENVELLNNCYICPPIFTPCIVIFLCPSASPSVSLSLPACACTSDMSNVFQWWMCYSVCLFPSFSIFA